jgi:Protease inhibitor Inh
MIGLRIAGRLVIMLTLAGCAGQQLSLGEAAAPAAPAAAVDMAGRWQLSAPNSPPCGMHFSGGPGIHTGAIQPEGGCPGQFFTARHWQLSKDGQLTIDDYQMNPLAELQFGQGLFTGKSNAGRTVTLSRFPSPPPG